MIALRDGVFLFSFSRPVILSSSSPLLLFLRTNGRRARCTQKRARTPSTPLLCTYVSNNGPEHPSFYIVISKHESKFIHYRTGEAATGVILYEDDTRGEYACTHTHVGIDNDSTFDRFRFLRFHSTRQPLAWHLFGGGYGPLGRLTFYRGFFLVPVLHA